MGKAVKPIIDGPEMPTHMAELILEVLEEKGVSRVSVLAGTGVRPVHFEQDDPYLTYRQYLAIINHALALSGIADLGLVVGSRENISTWGILGYAIMSCATYREAFYTGLKFHQAASGMMMLSVTEHDNGTCLHIDPPVPLGDALPFCTEEMVSGIITVFRKLVGNAIQPLRLKAAYPEPKYAREYRELLGCPVEFDQPANELWLTSPDDTPLPQADPVSARICRKLVEELLDKHGVEDDISREVRRIIMRTPGQIPDMETVAGELGISSRSLRRQLEIYGTNYQSIRDDVRRTLAIDYLRVSTMTLEHIAEKLGYSEVTNFRRAFKQWTGKPPSHFRAK